MARNYNFLARLDRSCGNYKLFVNGFHFGTFVNCEVAHIFESSDWYLADQINSRIEGDMSLKERLVIVRDCYVALDKEYAAEQAAEYHAENAWLRAAEYNPQYREEMEREDWFLG